MRPVERLPDHYWDLLCQPICSELEPTTRKFLMIAVGKHDKAPGEPPHGD